MQAKRVQPKRMSIYILELQDDKYYIGKTKNIEQRLKAHFNKEGAKWTTVHPPKAIFTVFNSTDAFDEDVYTKKFMYKYGIDNVRGGSYTTIELTPEQIALLQKEFATVDDVCFSCFKKHKANKCTETLTFGKYKDLRLLDVYNFDKDYLVWLSKQTFTKPLLKKRIAKLLKPDYRKCTYCRYLYPEYEKDVKNRCSKCNTKLNFHSIPFLRCDYCVKHNLPKSKIYGDGLCCSCGHTIYNYTD